MSHCGWNCQLAVGDNHPIPHPLAVILGHLMGHDAAGRRARGSRNTIPFFSSDKRRIIAELGRQAMSALGHKQTSRFIQSPRQQAAGAYLARRDLAL